MCPTSSHKAQLGSEARTVLSSPSHMLQQLQQSLEAQRAEIFKKREEKKEGWGKKEKEKKEPCFANQLKM